ncbi:MAG: LLM class F420-dependent oxidoreductase [Candidatus Promineifilaceae bacterium]
MNIGVVFPQTEFGAESGKDAVAIRDYAQAAEALGYRHIVAYDHVLGATPERQPRLAGPYTHKDPFYEPFVLFTFLAAVTKTIEFATCILILPQRQTAVVAKQAATLDLLSQGRLRLGVGIGWNWVEYQALGQDFRVRGRRIEEQVDLLRQLWTQPLVHYEGRWDRVPDAGLNPLPLQRPIPIWFGGHADAVLRRAARMGDGWMPNYRSATEARPALEKIATYLHEAGRRWEEFGLEPRLRFGEGNEDDWHRQIGEWRGAGATHLSLNTMHCGLDTPDAHIKAMETFAAAVMD